MNSKKRKENNQKKFIHKIIGRRSGRLMLVGILILIGICVLEKKVTPYVISGELTLTLNGAEELQVEYGTTYDDPGAKAVIRDEDVSNRITVVQDVDTSKEGTYEVIYKIKYRHQRAEVRRTVTVADTLEPVLTLNGDLSQTVASIDDYAEPGAIASDNYDGDVTDQIEITTEQVNDYTYRINYSVSDSHGNTATASREVLLTDTVPPVLTLNEGDVITVQVHENFEDPGATAIDERDGDVSAGVTAEGYVDIYTPGDYTITYTAADNSGNSAQITRTVKVEGSYSTPTHSIYLTFDDGPSSDVTEQILDTLKENGIQATFFICDYDEDKLPLIQRMLDEGHTIGIHGYSHDYAAIYTSADVFMDNIYTLRDKLKEDTGYEAFVIRFPGGSSNTVSAKYCSGVMTELVKRVTEAGLMYEDWNVSSGDAAGNNRPVDTIVANVEGGLKEDRHNVVLMHDTSAKQTTADALQTIIDYGKDNGYSFYPITKDTEPVHHAVNN